MEYWIEFARPFRMPDFFLIAGLFLSRTLDRPWNAFLDKKVVHFAYFFALWTTIYFAVHNLGGAAPTDGTGGIREYLYWYVEPFHMLWFIEMLPIYFIVTRLLAPVPWYYVLSGAAVLQMFAVHPEFGQLDRFCARYVYFYAGYRFAPLIFEFAGWAMSNRRASLLALLVWAVINEILVLADVQHLPGIELAMGFAGAGGVIITGCLLSGRRSMAWLRYLGQKSIVIFLSFFLFVMGIAKIYARTSLMPDQSSRTLLATALGIGGPILLFWAVRRTPARFLFQRPAWFRIPARTAQTAVVMPAETLAETLVESLAETASTVTTSLTPTA